MTSAHNCVLVSSRTRRHRWAGLLTALVCSLPVTSPGDPTGLNLQRLATYDSDRAYQKAFTECELATSVPAHVAASAARHFSHVVLVEEAGHAGQGLALAVRVTALDAPSGGGWSGGRKA